MEIKMIIFMVMLSAVVYMFGYNAGKSEPKPPEVPKTRYECLKLGSDFARRNCLESYKL